MLDPFSLLPLSLAAQRGRVDDFEAQQLVAAGLTLLQRSRTARSRAQSASARRSCFRRRPRSSPRSPPPRVAARCSSIRSPRRARSPTSFATRTSAPCSRTRALAAALPADIPRVLLDDAPRTARVLVDGASRDVDLGSHVGMTIEGDADARGQRRRSRHRLHVGDGRRAARRDPLAPQSAGERALDDRRRRGLSSDDRVLALLPFSHLFGLTVTASAPLLAGGAA